MKGKREKEGWRLKGVPSAGDGRQWGWIVSPVGDGSPVGLLGTQYLNFSYNMNSSNVLFSFPLLLFSHNT